MTPRATNNMESLLNQTSMDMMKDRLTPMVETLQELKTEVSDIITEGASDDDVRSLVSSKLDELFREHPQRPLTDRSKMTQ